MKNLSIFLVLVSFLFITGCQSEVPVQTETSDSFTLDKWGMPKEVHSQLQAVKAATAKYHDINQAIADGYEDIHVVVPNMGHHYAKEIILDEHFVLTEPEILVYTLLPNGHYKLVAVEYGVPLALSSTAPEGFIGSYDEWTENTDAGIWALHAWIWKDNPNGVFASFNPNVP